MMKQALSVILILVLSLSLWACGSESQNPGTDGNTTTSQTEPDDLVLYNQEDGYPYINTKKFKEILVTVELTTENWMDYIEVCSYTEEIIEKDAFGEITSSQTHTCYELGAKDNKYYHFREFAIELKNKATGELMTCLGNATNAPTLTEEIRLDQYECTRIKGILYLIDLPEEAIIQREDGQRMFHAGQHSDISGGPSYTCYLSGTDGRWVGGMFDFLVY